MFGLQIGLVVKIYREGSATDRATPSSGRPTQYHS